MLRTLLLLALIVMSTTGCIGLMLKPSDSAGEKTKKVLARIVLAPLTLGISEVKIAADREELIREVEARAWRNEWTHAVETSRTLLELSKIFRSAPIACSPTRPGFQVCEWQSGHKATVYWSQGPFLMPMPIGTVVEAVCELPTNGSEREDRSCSVTFR